MEIHCPFCKKKMPRAYTTVCKSCGCEIEMLRQITGAAHDSIQLALLALRDGRDDDAHELAHEAWDLRHSPEAAAIGLIAATSLADPIEIPCWIRRRRTMHV
jgi:hypothetical protein